MSHTPLFRFLSNLICHVEHQIMSCHVEHKVCKFGKNWLSSFRDTSG